LLTGGVRSDSGLSQTDKQPKSGGGNLRYTPVTRIVSLSRSTCGSNMRKNGDDGIERSSHNSPTAEAPAVDSIVTGAWLVRWKQARPVPAQAKVQFMTAIEAGLRVPGW
jgi:hypothetical protein